MLKLCQCNILVHYSRSCGCEFARAVGVARRKVAIEVLGDRQPWGVVVHDDAARLTRAGRDR